MIFYIALDDEGRRQLRGTQADAKAVNRNFEQIDIPTDKAGLMAFVQELYTEIDMGSEREFDPEAVIAEGLHADPAPLDSRQYAPTTEPYTERSVRFEDEFDNMSLALQLHYAARAMENAREAL